MELFQFTRVQRHARGHQAHAGLSLVQGNVQTNATGELGSFGQYGRPLCADEVFVLGAVEIDLGEWHIKAPVLYTVNAAPQFPIRTDDIHLVDKMPHTRLQDQATAEETRSGGRPWTK